MSISTVFLGLERRQPWFDARDRIPAILLLTMSGLALIWGALAGISFNRPTVLIASPLMLGLCFLCRRQHPDSKSGEALLYIALWPPLAAFGTELSFLITQMDLPLRDHWLMAADRAMGFDWIGWARFITSHPWLNTITYGAYSSAFAQPPLSVLIFALWGPRGRNGEFLTSFALGLLMTFTVYAFMPNIGPAAMYGVPAGSTEIVRQLRAGFAGPYSYAGIIAFPSFHVAMGILFTLAHRSSRPGLLAFGTLNLLMLGGVPLQGDHYFCDMVAGALIGTASFLAARRLYRAE